MKVCRAMKKVSSILELDRRDQIQVPTPFFLKKEKTEIHGTDI
jgi:hypothetical protein